MGWAFEENDLLRRVSEQEDVRVSDSKTVSTIPVPSESFARRLDPIADRRTISSKKDGTSKDESEEPSKGNDLWSLWEESAPSPSSNLVAGSTEDEATAPSRLREYLARPKRIG